MRPRQQRQKTLWPQADAASLAGRVRLWVAASGLLLLGERLLKAMLPLAGVIVLYCAVALHGVLAILPAWLHWTLLGGFALLAVVALYVGWRDFRLPARRDAIARLESDSGLAHRPITHLEDEQASNLVDPLASRLWTLHRARLAKAIGPLALRMPQWTPARRDPFALRFLLLLIVAAGLGLSWGQSAWLLQHGLMPRSQAEQIDRLSIEAWITPPGYTRLPPISLAASGELTSAGQAPASSEPIPVPAGSRLLVQVLGTSAKAVLDANDEQLSFESIDGTTQRLETELRKGSLIAINAGATLARWPIAIVPDMAPQATLEEPRSTERGVLRLRYGASDDFGVVEARLTVTRRTESFDLPIPVYSVDPRQVKGATFQDFTAHPWAGLDVELRIVAKDALGQAGASAPQAIVLPERRFFHPVARAIVALRKRLSADPAEAPAVARGLRQLQSQPQSFDDDIATYLALDFAARRLDVAGNDAVRLAAIQQLLWDSALALEDGGVSLAMRELRRLQRALEDALANGASDEEIQRLMNELQQAMNDYLEQLQRQIAKALEKGMQLGTLDENALALSQQDLNEMLNQARRMAESGARDSARQMLDQLQNLLENLQMGIPMMADRDSQAQRMLSDLGRIMRQQQQLLEDTFRMQRNRQPGESEGELGDNPTNGAPGPNQGAQRQEALRQMLGELMRRFSNMTGDIPQGMGPAEQAMRGASDALRSGELDEAAGAQNEALQNLQQSLQQMNEMMRQQIGSRQGQGQREPMDPFGRALSDEEGPGGDAVARDNRDRVPLDQELDRSRQLFEELRLRRNESARPKLERDYIDRLLRQF